MERLEVCIMWSKIPDFGYFVIGSFMLYQMVISYRIMILLEGMT